MPSISSKDINKIRELDKRVGELETALNKIYK
jgi:hypothetical protein